MGGWRCGGVGWGDRPWPLKTTTFTANPCALGNPLLAQTKTSNGVPQPDVYLHTDALGSIVAESNASGIVSQRNDYAPYGEAYSAPIDGLGYTGHEMDADTGLVYAQQRYYDPVIGRFLSVDPVGVDTSNGSNFSRYWYANNNPYRFTDPDGRSPPGCGDGTCRVSFLVSRPLSFTDQANHNFVVTGAETLGDPTAKIISFGDQGDDTLGNVDSKTEGFSKGTQATDTKAFHSLAGKESAATFRKIDASENKVNSIASSLKDGKEYSAVPEVEGGINSNSAAGAVAQQADGGPPRVDNGVLQPGSSQRVVNKVKFENNK